eukprot:UN06830
MFDWQPDDQPFDVIRRDKERKMEGEMSPEYNSAHSILAESHISTEGTVTVQEEAGSEIMYNVNSRENNNNNNQNNKHIMVDRRPKRKRRRSRKRYKRNNDQDLGETPYDENDDTNPLRDKEHNNKIQDHKYDELDEEYEPDMT